MKLTVQEYIDEYQKASHKAIVATFGNIKDNSVLSRLLQTFEEVNWSEWSPRQLLQVGWQSRNIETLEGYKTTWLAMPFWALKTLQIGFVYHDSYGNQIVHQEGAYYSRLGDANIDIGFFAEELPMSKFFINPDVTIIHKHSWQRENFARCKHVLEAMGLTVHVRMNFENPDFYTVIFNDNFDKGEDIVNSIVGLVRSMSMLCRLNRLKTSLT